MSNQSFNQFAGQPAPGPAPAPGYAQPGTPVYQGAPPPMGPPQGAPAWPNQPAQAPQGPPVQQYAPAQAPAPQGPPPGYQGTSQVPGPHGYGGPAGVPHGVPAPAQQYMPQAAPQAPLGTQNPYMGQQQPQQYAPAPVAAPAFGAGAFGDAKVMGDKLPCAPGLYRMRVVETGQRRDPKTQLPYWRLKTTVVQVLAGAQPQGSDVTTSQGLTGDQQVQYAGSFFLQLGAACLGVNNEAELKALLNQRYGTFQAPTGQLLDGWAQFADALQNATQQVNNCPPNPLAGAEFMVEVLPQAGTGKNAGKTFEKWQALRRVQA